jgi:hypothetical protein
VSKRRFAVSNAHIDRPDERFIREDQRMGPSVALVIVSEHLNGKPADVVRISDRAALVLAEQLISAVRNKGATS